MSTRQQTERRFETTLLFFSKCFPVLMLNRHHNGSDYGRGRRKAESAPGWPSSCQERT